jgi:hypothetical protein
MSGQSNRSQFSRTGNSGSNQTRAEEYEFGTYVQTSRASQPVDQQQSFGEYYTQSDDSHAYGVESSGAVAAPPDWGDPDPQPVESNPAVLHDAFVALWNSGTLWNPATHTKSTKDESQGIPGLEANAQDQQEESGGVGYNAGAGWGARNPGTRPTEANAQDQQEEYVDQWDAGRLKDESQLIPDEFPSQADPATESPADVFIPQGEQEGLPRWLSTEQTNENSEFPPTEEDSTCKYTAINQIFLIINHAF